MAIICTNQVGGESGYKSPRYLETRRPGAKAGGAVIHDRSLQPAAADAMVKMLDNKSAVGAAVSRMNGRVPIPDGVDLERLRIRAAELERQIDLHVNGQKARLETMRSDCLKAIGQLTLMNVKLP